MYYLEFTQRNIPAPNKMTGTTKVVCPECQGGDKREKSLYLNYDSGVYKCFRAKCGWKGKVGFKKEYVRPKLNNKTQLPDSVVKWFNGRGISQKTIEKLNITFDKGIEFNYFKNGQLVNVKSRSLKDKKFYQTKGAEKVLYNIDNIKGKDRVIIVEGEMDVLSWMEVIPKDWGVVSLDQGAGARGSSLGSKLECLTNCAEQLDKVKEFYLCLDKDEPGIWTQNELVRRFGDYRCNIVPLPNGMKDANDVLQDKLYPISTRRQTLKECLKKSKPVPIYGIQKLDVPTELKMLHQYRHGRIKGSTTHYPELDKYFTFLKGEITMFTGTPGSGKSQFCRMLALLKSYYDGWKWACYCPEDAPKDYFYDDLIEIFLGKSADINKPNACTEDEYILGMSFIKDHFFFIYPEKVEGKISMPTNTWINERIKFLRLKYGVNAYIKDPWNKIYHSFRDREDQYLAKELSEEKFFAAEYDAAFYINHPVGQKVSTDKTGEFKPVGLYDVSGGSMWFNQIDNGLVINRPFMNSNDTDRTVDVFIKKIKKKKQVGKLGKVEFEYFRGENRYYSLNVNDIKEDPFIKNVHEDEEDIPF